MITLLYCKELNTFRIRNILTGIQTVKTEEQLKNAGVQSYVIDAAKQAPNEEKIIGY